MSRAKRGVSKDGNNGDISHPRAVYRAQARRPWGPLRMSWCVSASH